MTFASRLAFALAAFLAAGASSCGGSVSGGSSPGGGGTAGGSGGAGTAGGSSGGSGGGGGGAMPDAGCHSDSDCSIPNRYCNTATGQCVQCLPATDTCPFGRYCVKASYTCQPGCKNDAECNVHDGGTLVCVSHHCQA